MSIQAEHCVQVLMLLYAELDQRSGWGDTTKIIEYFRKEGISAGRTEAAIRTLKNLKMLDTRSSEGGEELRMSAYGVVWFEKNLPLESRGDNYTYSLPLFRSIKLVGPEEFYGSKGKPGHTNAGLDWTKWGALIAALIGVLTIAIMKGWL